MTVFRKAVEAKCMECPHVDLSMDPKRYLCSGCYYARKARGCVSDAKELRGRADKLDVEAGTYYESAGAFMRRNPKSGPKELRADLKGPLSP